jgi:transposase
VLYDLTSSCFEGHHCPLARFGYSRDERRSNPQIVFGILSTAEVR